ncbi:HEAT repeat domain-containing protein [Streptomyces sp. 4503]|uniref:HEAT repeat domain-containing protein n=1 Tax=Streptomyces niphimycinicus TaxID=2842201 RepID=A0ABS6C7P4_9ACTN|nr:HEAT repeat domain-containing protein [Streptomyces niphimycinicus]MBU3862909.1 HEAT repeat domain-containing protein [Streptomyces niphimycinicus]
MGFKEDAVFARFLSMGVYAADAVAQDLELNHGHRIIKLDRFATSNKVWQTKVKRMRLPDLLCVSCGRRFECKGKTKLEIILSDSKVTGRTWRDGGMCPDDVFAFACVDMKTSPVSVSNLVYVTRQSLEDALGSSKAGKRKSASEGSELDRRWPMWASDVAGEVLTVDDDLKKLRVTKGASTYLYWQGRSWGTFHTLAAGTAFEAGQPVAFCFRMADSIACAGDGSWSWKEDLLSTDDDIRFPAVKAARFLGAEPVEDMLIGIADDEVNDRLLRLEAHASLAPTRPASVAALLVLAEGADSADEVRMEAVFCLSEIDAEEATEALYSIASSTKPAIPEEVRAAAAWGLGTGARKAPAKLMHLVNNPSVLVAAHAAAAIPSDLPQECLDELLDWLRADADDLHRAATAAHLLADRDLVAELVNALPAAPERVRRLIVLALGDASREAVSGLLSGLDAQSRAGIAILWAKSDDWLRQPDTDGILDALKLQTLRR